MAEGKGNSEILFYTEGDEQDTYYAYLKEQLGTHPDST
jgi:hypothetical protein